MRRATFVLAAIGVLAALLAAATSASAASINWGACSDPNLQQAGAQCGYLSVPLDYSNPNGRHIELAVSRIEHTASAKHYQGVIITNPGGPGAPGLDLNTYLTPVLQQEGYSAAVADYDWIGFDPRGVGSSIPTISCDPNYLGPDRPSYVPYTRALLDTWLTRSKDYAADCVSKDALQTELLNNMTTRDNAMDVDSIRQALGQQQITYYGFSWGTDLGQVYATLYPTHLRRLIMDSNIDPLRDAYEAFNLDQDIPINRNVNIWFAWLAKYNNVYHLGSTEQAVQKQFYDTERELAAHPAGGVVGPDEWVDTFLEVGYINQVWAGWGQAFSDWVHHVPGAADELIGLYHAVDAPGADNVLAVYLSVICTDSPWPTNWSIWNRDTWAIFSIAPFEAWGNTWFNAPCAFWRAPAQQQVRVNGSGVSSALLIDETRDAATPFPGSVVTRFLFPHSVLLAEPGGT
jgi:pimeloyl-ACP methyl ester carboxylesterase